MLRCDECKKFVKEGDTLKLTVIDKTSFRILCLSCFMGAKVLKI